MEKVWCAICMLLAAAHLGSGQTLLQIFEKKDFQGLLQEQTSKSFGCQNLVPQETDAGVQIRQSSLKVLDDDPNWCVMLYTTRDCKDSGQNNEYSIRVDRGEYANINTSVIPTAWGTHFKSYNDCPTTSKLQSVTLYSDINAETKDRLNTYSNICGCTTLLTDDQRKARSIINGGNCINLYSNLNCEGTPSRSVPGGVHPMSLNLGTSATARSIGSCGAAPSCITFVPEVIGMNLTGTVDPVLFSNSTNFVDKLNEPALYRNNASVPVKVDYNKTREVDEAIEIDVPAIQNIDGFSHNHHVEISTNDKFPIFIKKRIADALKVVYGPQPPSSPPPDYEPPTFLPPESYEEDQTYTINPKTPFEIKQTVEVPACTLYKVRSHVTELKDFEVSYEITIRLTGARERTSTLSIPMTAKELEVYSKLSGFEYVAADGAHAVIVKVGAKLKATLGVETVVDDEAEEITDNCESNAGVFRVGLPLILISVLAYYL